jgi:hypothetical protein
MIHKNQNAQLGGEEDEGESRGIFQGTMPAFIWKYRGK